MFLTQDHNHYHLSLYNPGFTNNRLQVFCKHNLQSNVSPENVLAILQAADRMRAADIKEYALKMITHHFGLVRIIVHLWNK